MQRQNVIHDKMPLCGMPFLVCRNFNRKLLRITKCCWPIEQPNIRPLPICINPQNKKKIISKIPRNGRDTFYVTQKYGFPLIKRASPRTQFYPVAKRKMFHHYCVYHVTTFIQIIYEATWMVWKWMVLWPSLLASFV